MTSGGRRGVGPSERTESHDVPGAPREALITSHLGLARFLATRFADRGEPYEDLVQVASMALVQAADRYDASLGFKFSTFATRTIVGELKHHFRDKGWAVSTPRHVKEHYLEVSTAVGELVQRLGRSPTVGEIAEACRLTSGEVLVAIEAGQSYRVASLETALPGADAVIDVHEQVDDAIVHADERSELLSHLGGLSDRDQTLLRLRFVDELSQTEIAERIGVSQMHVSRLLRQALQTLRDALDAGR
jgi:RNA polymerase sigma-B factor